MRRSGKWKEKEPSSEKTKPLKRVRRKKCPLPHEDPIGCALWNARRELAGYEKAGKWLDKILKQKKNK